LTAEPKTDADRARRLFPERPFRDCIHICWRLLEVGKVQGITPEVLSRVSGCPGGGEELRSLVLSLRCLGLVKRGGDGLAITKNCWELSQQTTGSARYRRLLWQILHTPSAYEGLPQRFRSTVPATAGLASSLQEVSGLPPQWATVAAINYREALLYAGLMTENGDRIQPELRVVPRHNPDLAAVRAMLTAQEPEPEPEAETTGDRLARVTPVNLPSFTGAEFQAVSKKGHVLRLELGPGRSAQLQLPADLTPAEIDRLVNLLRVLGND